MVKEVVDTLPKSIRYNAKVFSKKHKLSRVSTRRGYKEIKPEIPLVDVMKPWGI